MRELGEYLLYFFMSIIGVPIMLVVLVTSQYNESPLLLALGFLVTWVGMGFLIMKITKLDEMLKGVLGI